MLSFKKFLLEAVDPIKFLQRINRMRGMDSTDEEETSDKSTGDIHSKTVKTRIVKLKHDPESSEEMYNKLPWKMGLFDNAETRKFKIKELNPTQSSVRVDDVDRLKQKLDTPPMPSIVTHKGKHYVVDGHHGIMMSRLQGNKSIVGKHINLDELPD